MALIYTELPMYQDFYYRYGISLEGQQRTLTFYWNEREGAWFFDMSNLDGAIVISGQKLVPQTPLMLNLPLSSLGLTGYFMLLPNNLATKVNPADSTIVPQFFKLFYIYEEAT